MEKRQNSNKIQKKILKSEIKYEIDNVHVQGSLNHNFLLIFQSLMTVTGQTERWMGDGHKKLIRKPTKSIGLFWPPLLGLVQTSCSHLHISIYLSTSPHISIHISMSWCRQRRLCVHHKLSAKQGAYIILHYKWLAKTVGSCIS